MVEKLVSVSSKQSEKFENSFGKQSEYNILLDLGNFSPDLL